MLKLSASTDLVKEPAGALTVDTITSNPAQQLSRGAFDLEFSSVSRKSAPTLLELQEIRIYEWLSQHGVKPLDVQSYLRELQSAKLDKS